jgi:creatinine amidohydrolase
VSRSSYLPEMTSLEVHEYLEEGHSTVLIPVGSTEDHGDHGPLWTDVYIPLEVAKRAAAELEALVGPPISFGIAHDHRGAAGVVNLRLGTFVSLVRDVCLSFADSGFRRIVLLNGHYCNTHPLELAVSQFFDQLPPGARVFTFPYWAGLRPEEAEAYLSGSVGLHANVGETSAVLAIDTRLCDMERVRDYMPDFGELRTSPLKLVDPVFLTTPGSFWSLLREGGGIWGRPSESSSEKGEQFLEWCTRAVVDMVHDLEAMHDRLEPGYLLTKPVRQPSAGGRGQENASAGTVSP